MKKTAFILIIIFLTNFSLTTQIKAETTFDEYLNDFYSKSSEARNILKEIQISLKEGSRSHVCAKQRKAAKLALLANNSLIKAFEIAGSEVPAEAIKASEKKWKSILNEC